MMQNEDFSEVLDGAGRWSTVTVERPKLCADFLRDLVREDSEIGKATVAELIEMFDEEGL